MKRFQGTALLAFAAAAAALFHGCGAQTPGAAGPRVTGTEPADGATDVPLLSQITVRFSDPMDPGTVTTNTGTSCSGAIQVSLASADFASCVPMSQAPLASTDGRAFTVSPAAALESGETYRVRVVRTAASLEQRILAAEYETANGFTTQIGPGVVSTIPADGATAVAGTSFSVTFDRPMNAGTLTANTNTDFCTGSLQVSNDEFATCVQMAAAPATADDATFTFAAAAPLDSRSTYRVRVTTAATSQAGDPMVLAFTQPNGFGTSYRHTIAIDGTNDFLMAEERFQSTSSGTGYYGYVAWDSQYVYVGMEGADVEGNDPVKAPNTWVLLYVGGADGTTTGQTYNTQQPTLPFPAKWHVRWKADPASPYTNAQVWNSGTSAWDDAMWDFTGDVFRNGTFVEIRIPRAEIGTPSTMALHASMLNETALSEGTYAAVPSTSLVGGDGYDPDYTKYFEFDLDGDVVPNAHQPLP